MAALFAVAGILYLAFGDTSEAGPTGAAAAFLAGASFFLLERLATDARRLGLFVKTNVLHRKRLVRLSVSYLFRIKVDNRYLLIRGIRRPGQYQPVGGVFKRYPESTEQFSKWGVQDDDCIPIDKSSENDLRLRIPMCHIVPFLRWFEKGVGRELSPWREFYEELVKPGYLSADSFPYIDYRFIKDCRTGLEFREEFSRYEIKVAEIYELLPSDRQLECLRKLDRGPTLIWVDEETIRQRGVVPRQQPEPTIAAITQWIV